MQLLIAVKTEPFCNILNTSAVNSSLVVKPTVPQCIQKLYVLLTLIKHGYLRDVLERLALDSKELGPVDKLERSEFVVPSKFLSCFRLAGVLPLVAMLPACPVVAAGYTLSPKQQSDLFKTFLST